MLFPDATESVLIRLLHFKLSIRSEDSVIWKRSTFHGHYTVRHAIPRLSLSVTVSETIFGFKMYAYLGIWEMGR